MSRAPNPETGSRPHPIDGDTLVTDQPSHPREERTRFDLLGQTLVLHYGGGKARFTRGSRRCPVV